MIARTRTVLVAALAAAAGLTTACSGGSSTAARDVTATAQPRPSAAASLTPASQLVALARAGNARRYSAVYVVHGKAAAGVPVSLTVFRAPPAYRVDITSRGATAQLIGTPAGAVACRLSKAARACFAVGGPGQPGRPLFDAGVQRVFTSYLAVLATRPDLYTVAARGVTPPRGALPGGRCFAVAARTGATTQVASGMYCFASTGVVVKISYPSGEMLLSRLAGAPNPVAFRPVISPSPLPH